MLGLYYSSDRVASRSKQLHCCMQLLVGTSIGLVSAYPAWRADCSQQHRAAWQVAVLCALWTTATPWLVAGLLQCWMQGSSQGVRVDQSTWSRERPSVTSTALRRSGCSSAGTTPTQGTSASDACHAPAGTATCDKITADACHAPAGTAACDQITATMDPLAAAIVHTGRPVIGGANSAFAASSARSNSAACAALSVPADVLAAPAILGEGCGMQHEAAGAASGQGTAHADLQTCTSSDVQPVHNSSAPSAAQHRRPAQQGTPQRHLSLRGLQGCQQHVEAQRQGDPTLYQPAFPRMKVVARLHVGAGMAALPADLSTCLQGNCNTSATESWQFLTVAAREGCILLSIDIAPQLPPHQHQHIQQQHDWQHQQQLMQLQDWPGLEQQQDLQQQGLGLQQQGPGLQQQGPGLQQQGPGLQQQGLQAGLGEGQGLEHGSGHGLALGEQAFGRQGQGIGQAVGQAQGTGQASSQVPGQQAGQQRDAGSFSTLQSQVATTVLDALQPILHQLESSSWMSHPNNRRPALANGLRVTVQADDSVYEAVWNAGMGCWDVQLVSNSALEPKPCLGLAWMLDCASMNSTGISSRQCKGNNDHSITCKLQVQVWDVPHSVGQVEGWGPDQAQHQTPPVRDPTMRLMIHSQGIYLPTQVAHVPDSASSSSVTPARAALLNVDVEVPTSALIRHHHTNGPVTGLQPLVLELWAGEQLHHATHMLLVLSPQRDRRAWWWGADPAAVQNAVQELQAAQQQLLALGAAVRLTEVKAHHALQADVCTWLEGLRWGAAKCGYCPAGLASPHPPGPSLHLPPAFTATAPVSLALIQHTGQCLEQYAAKQGLSGMHTMLLQQKQQVIAPWQHKERLVLMGRPAQPPSMWARTAAARRQLRVLFTGFPCARCEAYYKTRLSQQLTGIQFTGACIHTVGISITVYQQYNQLDPGIWWMLTAQLLTNIVIAVQHVYMPGQCSRFVLLSWAIRMFSAWPIVNQLVPDTTPAAQSMRVLMYIIGSISDQLPALVFLPVFITMALSIIDTCVWCWLLSHHHSTGSRDWALMAIGMSVLWWLQLQLRNVLKPGRHHKQAWPAREFSQHNGRTLTDKKHM